MAGYFNPDALDDPEVMGELTDHAHRAWIVLCLERHPRCGIFRPNLRLWAARCRTPLDELPACLDAFERLGWIKRDGDLIWIVNYTKHQSKQKEWRLAARDEALALIGTTSLAEMWLEAYPDIDAIPRDRRADFNLKSVAKSLTISLPSDSTDRTDSTDSAPTPPADASERELLILHVLKEIPSHPFDYRQDLDYIRTLAVEFPHIDLLNVARELQAWLLDNPRKKSGRLRLRNFCKNARPTVEAPVQRELPDIFELEARR